VTPIDPDEVARRMVPCLAYERRALLAAYDRFRFAFPERRNEFLESAGEEESRLLSHALEGKLSFEIRHRYPTRLSELYDAARPFCG
jgi:hypothetical protein